MSALASTGRSFVPVGSMVAPPSPTDARLTAVGPVLRRRSGAQAFARSGGPTSGGPADSAQLDEVSLPRLEERLLGQLGRPLGLASHRRPDRVIASVLGQHLRGPRAVGPTRRCSLRPVSPDLGHGLAIIVSLDRRIGLDPGGAALVVSDPRTGGRRSRRWTSAVAMRSRHMVAVNGSLIAGDIAFDRDLDDLLETRTRRPGAMSGGRPAGAKDRTWRGDHPGAANRASGPDDEAIGRVLDHDQAGDSLAGLEVGYPAERFRRTNRSSAPGEGHQPLPVDRARRSPSDRS